MGIDKHLILTLARSKERQLTVRGGATAMQTPAEKIHFVKGHDNKNFNDDMKAIAKAAEDDGFPFIEQFTHGLKNDAIQQSASGACQTWNFSRILRHIATGTETCLITWDDRVLTLPFPWIEKITEELQSRKEEFYLWQLRIRIGDTILMENERICKVHPELVGGDAEKRLELMDKDFDAFNDGLNNRWKKEYEDFIETQYKSYEFLKQTDKYVDTYLQKNILGYDESFVISPKGAAWLLLEAFNMEELDPSQETDDMPYWETAVCRRTCFDAWIGLDLVHTSVKKAVAEKKGIYCPRKIGYRYIHDWLPMGSSVDWANKDNTKFEKFRTEHSEMKFIDIP